METTYSRLQQAAARALPPIFFGDCLVLMLAGPATTTRQCRSCAVSAHHRPMARQDAIVALIQPWCTAEGSACTISRRFGAEVMRAAVTRPPPLSFARLRRLK